ncbi:MAG: 50S ribosomal protein L15 [Methanophagales archaeon ANME-1-THS]|nr:MAG: 50S ribosomal protein L15 [Methanophagales archaeon ANME-1-THS]
MKKRIKRIRGTRTCGGGSHKKRRGKGSKGGVGNAGAYDVHVVRSLKMGIVKGKRGSALHPRGHREDTVMNIGELEDRLEELVMQGKAEPKGESIYLDAHALGIEKLLGKGTVTKKLILKANKISKTARKKIEQVGGVVEMESGV